MFRTSALIGASLALALLVGVFVETVAPVPARAEPVVIDIMASDYAFDAPDSIPAGLVTVRLMNHGQEPHHAQFLRLNEGVTFAQFATALQEQGEAAVQLTTLTGGPGALSPFKSGEVTLDLTPGQYVLACFIGSDDGVPHLAKGMLKPISVTDEGSGMSDLVDTIAVAGTVNMRDFTFDIPDSIPAGPVTYRVVNAGPQPHEFNLLKLTAGSSVSDLLAWDPASGTPPPFEAVGGMNGLSQGEVDYVHVDLEPGTYVAICNIPDPASGVPHSHLGMYREFTVTP